MTPGRFWLRVKPHFTSWAGLAPFLAFALFPFYWGLITSLKADANLYDLKANPFWFASRDKTTGKPYHKDIIIPASLTEGTLKWKIPLNAATTRSDSEQNPRPIAFIGEQPIVSPVDGVLSEKTVAEGAVAHPNEVIGVIRVASPTTTHYRYLKSTPFYRWMRVSLVTGLAVVAITLLLAVPAAYGLARLRFPGNRPIGIAIFLTYLIPPTILFIPFSQFVGAMHIDNTIWSLILTYPTFTVPFCTWLLMGFFRSVPKEIEERALLDGATRFQMLRQVVIPVVLPGILTAAIFAFTLSFQEYIYGLTFISSTVNRTIPVGISVEMVRGDVYFWGPLMASAILGSIPVVIVYALSLDYFISGMTTGAVK
ncbi:MAG TPA: ABC transporter permease subunit [Thermoanaerobaculia bacterium]|nr:ABC transporter permease subunit [Thermoanaerobaculia bacterium]